MLAIVVMLVGTSGLAHSATLPSTCRIACTWLRHTALHVRMAAALMVRERSSVRRPSPCSFAATSQKRHDGIISCSTHL